MKQRLAKAIGFYGLSMLVALFWWVLPEIFPRYAWLTDKALLCSSAGLVAAIFIDQVTTNRVKG